MWDLGIPEKSQGKTLFWALTPTFETRRDLEIWGETALCYFPVLGLQTGEAYSAFLLKSLLPHWKSLRNLFFKAQLPLSTVSIIISAPIKSTGTNEMKATSKSSQPYREMRLAVSCHGCDLQMHKSQVHGCSRRKNGGGGASKDASKESRVVRRRQAAGAGRQASSVRDSGPVGSARKTRTAIR